MNTAKGYARCLISRVALSCLFFAVVSPCFGESKRLKVLFLGDSLTAGFGVGEEAAFPRLVERTLGEEGLRIHAINAGVSGDTTAGGVRRIDWLLKQRVHILVLALGANDALRGLPPRDTRSNLEKIIEAARKKYPELKVVLVGMRAPPSMGKDFTEEFDGLFALLAKDMEILLIPFLLEGVAGVEEFNQADQIHPNEHGHRKIAALVVPALRNLIEEVGSSQ